MFSIDRRTGNMRSSLALALLCTACGGSSATTTGAGGGAASGGNSGIAAQGGLGSGDTSGGTASGGIANGGIANGATGGDTAAGGAADGGAAGSGAACVPASAKAVLSARPVDIIIVIDNSGSMVDEVTAMEPNINLNFASILAAAGVDYRVILITRHRKDLRDATGASATSICIEAPLSGLAHCPSPSFPTPAPTPVFSPHFFQYNLKVESDNSLDVLLASYSLPDVVSQLTAVGWKEWLRPGARKVMLEVSDDDELNLSADGFLTALSALAPEFGTDPQHPSFVFHSIVGVAEKVDPTQPYLPAEPIQTALCVGNADLVSNAGSTYQDLSRRTGGLRFPICQFQPGGYDAVFRTIATDVSSSSQVACDFPIPELASAQPLDLSTIALRYQPSNGTGVLLERVSALAACKASSFYIQGVRISLCPDTCTMVQADSAPTLDVLFTCPSIAIGP